MLLTILASCTAVAPDNSTTDEALEQTNSDIDAELDETIVEEVEVSETDTESYEEAQDNSSVSILEESEFEVKKIQVLYDNPAQEVFIDMEYVLDDDDKISEIQILDSNYADLDSKLSAENLQVLIGKSLDEVEDTYVAGGSLTIAAVKKALASSD